jgi:DNA polymerase III alpha subunit (gram-positive type)
MEFIQGYECKNFSQFPEIQNDQDRIVVAHNESFDRNYLNQWRYTK